MSPLKFPGFVDDQTYNFCTKYLLKSELKDRQTKRIQLRVFQNRKYAKYIEKLKNLRKMQEKLNTKINSQFKLKN